MPLKRAIPPPTAEQQRRHNAARARGCIFCQMHGTSAPLPQEIHHQTEAGRQLGQDHTVCACAWHHRAVLAFGMSTSQMEAWHGPSLANGSRPFFAFFGSNAEHLAYQNSLIGYTAAPITAREAKRARPARGATARPRKVMARSA